MSFEGYKAALNSIESYQEGLYLVQGINKQNTMSFENRNYGHAHGSNGTYLMTDEAYTVTVMNLYVHELKKRVSINIRDELLEWSGRKRLTKKFLAKVQYSLPKNIWIAKIDGVWTLQKETWKKLHYAVMMAR